MLHKGFRCSTVSSVHSFTGRYMEMASEIFFHTRPRKGIGAFGQGSLITVPSVGWSQTRASYSSGGYFSIFFELMTI